MNKLSKEQAQWLIEKITGYEDGYNGDIHIKRRHLDYFLKEINQCTEKEFPKYELHTQDGNIDIKIEANFLDGKFSQVGMEFDDKDEGFASVPLYANEFKQFTEACSKILEWLDESKELLGETN